jgi:asparagine synthase (glutamine-hydrolysing)
MSMAHGVEARPPFLDHRLWTHVAALPASLRRGKRLLRDAMAGTLPSSTLRRPKLGLATPHAAWWRQPRLPGWAEDVLTARAFAAVGLVDGERFAALRRDHVAGSDRSGLLTGALTTQLWAAKP